MKKNVNYKGPKTDNGFKKSARGLLRVDEIDGKYVLTDRVTSEEEEGGALETVFIDGNIVKDFIISAIRTKLKSNYK